MAQPGITPTRGRKPQKKVIAAKSISTALSGTEKPYNAYRFSRKHFLERPHHNPFAGLGHLVEDNFERLLLGDGWYDAGAYYDVVPGDSMPEIVIGTLRGRFSGWNGLYAIANSATNINFNQYIEATLATWVATGPPDYAQYPSLWLWGRASFGVGLTSGYYNYLEEDENGLSISHSRWEAPSTYISLDTVTIPKGVGIPAGTVFRLELENDQMRSYWDRQQGDGMELLLTSTIDPDHFAGQVGIGLGSDSNTSDDFTIDSYRAGNL